jgi:hypothetical protein
VEVIGEFTNLFNIVNVSGINQTVPVRVNSSNPLDPTNGAPILIGTNILTTSNRKWLVDQRLLAESARIERSPERG